jgi:hypothetical protein
MVVPEISAVRPRVMTSLRISETCRRDSGKPRRLGSSQASALTSMTSSGGKGLGSSSPWAFGKAAEPLGEAALAPLGDDLAAGVQAGRDLVVVEPSAAMSTILARTTSRYGNVYLRARASRIVRSWSLNSMVNGLVLGIGLPRRTDHSVAEGFGPYVAVLVWRVVT